MIELTTNLRTRCVGRYLIDMPADSLVSGGATVKGVRIEPVAMSHEAYVREIASRRAVLRATKSIDQYPFLYVDSKIDGSDANLFVHRGHLSAGPAKRVFEAYKWDHGFRFKLEVEGNDYLHPDQTSKPYIQALDVKNDVPEKTHLVTDIIENIRWRAEDETPSAPGLCFLGGFLPGKAGDEENVVTQFVLASHRDVSFDLESNSGIREPNSLLERGAQIDAGLKSMKGGRTIRKGKVALQGVDAEEWLIAGETDLGVQGSLLRLEANSKISGAQSPLLILDLDTGSPNAFMQDRILAASMSESEAIALWDVVSRTLRPRPNGF